MNIAEQKRKENIAEYILFMWQITDLLRSLSLDEARIRQVLVDPLSLPPVEAEKELCWYAELCRIIKEEGKAEKGFISITELLMDDLYDFHLRLMNEPKDSTYKLLVLNAAPAITSFKEKVAEKLSNDTAYAFYALYSKMLLKMKMVEVGEHTKDAFEEITRMVAYLSKRFMQFEKGTFSFTED